MNEVGRLVYLTLEATMPLSIHDGSSLYELYDQDIIRQRPSPPLTSRGTRLREEPTHVLDEAKEIGAYYGPLVHYAYANGEGIHGIENLTRMIIRYGFQEVVDLLASLGAMYHPGSGDRLSLFVSSEKLAPGDLLKVDVSLLKNELNTSQGGPTDIYIAISTEGDGRPWFFDGKGGLNRAPNPWRSLEQTQSMPPQTLFSFIIPNQDLIGTYTLYGVATRKGAPPWDSSQWKSNLASVTFEIGPFDCWKILDEIRDEPYALGISGERSDKKGITRTVLRQWDLIFLGDLRDDPRTPGNEATTDPLIPGTVNHMMIYLGRDHHGRPIAMEMSANLEMAGPMLRVVWLPEMESHAPPVYEKQMGVPFFMKDLRLYGTRMARRLRPGLLAKARQHANGLIAQMEEDLCSALPYQLEYEWSGDVNDKEVYLVDDGRLNGSSCTDYWLSLFEVVAGVCIHNTRMKAGEIKDYFLTDPVGSKAAIPDELNPFPFKLYVHDLFEMGFTLMDPPPHVFPCDGTTETGVPLPDRTSRSPDLVPVPVITTRQ